MPTCYMCEKQTTSKEHIPPRCIFPEGKDAGGKDYRKNLISVLSCDEHNSEKSENDEYLMQIIVWHFENNEAARRQADSKVMRSIIKHRKKSDFVKTLQYRNINGILLPTFIFDAERVQTELDHIARGLYFWEFRKKNTDPLVVLTPVLFNTETENSYARNYQRQDLRAVTRRYMQNFPKKGDNPEIFYYQIDKSEGAGRLLLRMVFYEGFEVSVGTINKKDSHD